MLSSRWKALLLKCDQKESYQLKCTQEFLFQTELSTRNQSYNVAAIDREIKGIQFLPDRPKLLQIAVSLKYLAGNLFPNSFSLNLICCCTVDDLFCTAPQRAFPLSSPWLFVSYHFWELAAFIIKRDIIAWKADFCLRLWYLLPLQIAAEITGRKVIKEKTLFFPIFELVHMDKWPLFVSVSWGRGRMGQHFLTRCE